MSRSYFSFHETIWFFKMSLFKKNYAVVHRLKSFEIAIKALDYLATSTK